ncbi:MAG: phytoene desaturase [Aquiluna sp.]|nr:phytoene desaturase [Aquiluna sp.]MCF8546147.1 phytoene desaturase [Aquiluna sp.]
MSQKTAIVIGGGIAGLSSAALLAKAGMKVQLFEARESLGGRAYLWEKDGFRFDMGPSWYLMPDAFDQFFRLMGTSADQELDLQRLSPAYQTRNEGLGDRLVMSEKLDEIKEMFEGIEPGAGQKLQEYLDSAQSAYDLSIKHFLYTNFKDPRSFFQPEVLAKLGTFLKLLLTSLYDFSGKYVKDERLKKMLNFPAVFLGASPYNTPSMYHLMTHVDMNQGVFYPQGGLYTIIEAIDRLARKHGVEIHTSSPVTKILSENGKAVGVQVGASTYKADVVVASADLQFVETKLLDAKDQSLPQKWWDKKVPGPSALLIYLGVKGKIDQLDHHTLLYTKDWAKNFAEVFKKADGKSIVPNPASLYICMPSKTDKSVAPEGFENIFVLVPIAADPSIGRGGIDRQGDEAFEKEADRIIDQIAQWCEIPDLHERIVVRRTMGPKNFEEELNAWSGTALGMAHTLTQSAFFRPKNYSKKLKNLFYTGHNTIPGIGLPMCLIGAELVYKHLTNDRSSGPIPGELKEIKTWKGLA